MIRLSISSGLLLAEFTLGQVLAHYQHVIDNHAAQQAKGWKHRGFREIMGSRWVLIGFGEIGKETARRAKAFGAHITAVRRGVTDLDGEGDREDGVEDFPRARLGLDAEAFGPRRLLLDDLARQRLRRVVRPRGAPVRPP